MIFSVEEFLELRMSPDPAKYRRSTHDQAPTAVWRKVIADHPDMRKSVAHNATVPLEILRTLADDADPKVRMTVAMSSTCDEALFEKLATDEDPSVRLCVAYNEKASRVVLETLAKDRWERVVGVALGRLEPQT